MRTKLQNTLAVELKELVGNSPGPRLAELLHLHEAGENVARELLTSLEPETNLAVAAVLDLVTAQMELTVELLRELKAPR